MLNANLGRRTPDHTAGSTAGLLLARLGWGSRLSWRAPWARDVGESRIGSAVRTLAATAAVGLGLGAVGVLVLALAGHLLEQPNPLLEALDRWLEVDSTDSAEVLPIRIFAAELLAGLALLHGHVALRLRRSGVGAYRSALVLGGLWLLVWSFGLHTGARAAVDMFVLALPAPLALTILVWLLLPVQRGYFLTRATAAPVPVSSTPPPAAETGRATDHRVGPPTDADQRLASGGPLALLSPDWRDWLLAQGQPESFAAGAVVLREGDAGEDLYCLVEGALAVSGRGLGGEILALTRLQPGEWFGETALATGAPRTATVQAITAARVLRFPAAAVRQALATHPAFAAALRQRIDLLDAVGFLQRCSPFAGLPQATIVALVERLRRYEARAGTTLVCAGDAAAAWYLVKRGSAEAVWPDGRRLRLGPGDGFGEQALLGGVPSGCTVTATADLEVLALQRGDFQSVVAAYPRLRGFFHQLLHVRHAGTPDVALSLADVASAPALDLARQGRGRFLALLAGGTLLLAALSVLSLSTQLGIVNLATALVGALVAPAVYFRYLWERDLLRALSWKPFAAIFAIMALVGLPVAIVLELILTANTPPFATAMLIGVIEETMKLVAVVWLLWRRPFRFELDGIIFGVAAGMAFASIEDIGYAFSGDAGFDLSIVWVRFLTSFVGHPVWTGLICAAIWRAKGPGGPRLTWPVVGAWALSVVMHGLWDWSVPVFALPVGVVSLLLLRRRIWQAGEAQQEALQALALVQPIAVDGVLPEQADPPCPNCRLAPAPGTLYCARCGAALQPVEQSAPAPQPLPLSA